MSLDDPTVLAQRLAAAERERDEARAELADLVARVDNAQQLAGMGDYDWHIPTDTNRWSDQLYRIYGHEPQSFNASYERFLGHIHPDDRERIAGIHQRAYAAGEPYQMIERVVRPDGEVRYLSSNGQVVTDESGTPVRMRGTCIDITDRVLAEAERERVAARFRSLVESAPESILVVDRDDVVVQANRNATDLLGGDPVGHRVTELLALPDDSSADAVDGRGLDGRELRLDVTTAALGEAVPQYADVPVASVPEEGLTAVFLRDAGPRLESEAAAAFLRELDVRRRQALEINDNVVQGLTAAMYALEMEDVAMATTYLQRTLASARRMIDGMVEPVSGELAPGGLTRSTASSLEEPGQGQARG